MADTTNLDNPLHQAIRNLGGPSVDGLRNVLSGTQLCPWKPGLITAREMVKLQPKYIVAKKTLTYTANNIVLEFDLKHSVYDSISTFIGDTHDMPDQKKIKCGKLSIVSKIVDDMRYCFMETTDKLYKKHMAVVVLMDTLYNMGMSEEILKKAIGEYIPATEFLMIMTKITKSNMDRKEEIEGLCGEILLRNMQHLGFEYASVEEMRKALNDTKKTSDLMQNYEEYRAGALKKIEELMLKVNDRELKLKEIVEQYSNYKKTHEAEIKRVKQKMIDQGIKQKEDIKFLEAKLKDSEKQIDEIISSNNQYYPKMELAAKETLIKELFLKNDELRNEIYKLSRRMEPREACNYIFPEMRQEQTDRYVNLLLKMKDLESKLDHKDMVLKNLYMEVKEQMLRIPDIVACGCKRSDILRKMIKDRILIRNKVKLIDLYNIVYPVDYKIMEINGYRFEYDNMRYWESIVGNEITSAKVNDYIMATGDIEMIRSRIKSMNLVLNDDDDLCKSHMGRVGEGKNSREIKKEKKATLENIAIMNGLLSVAENAEYNRQFEDYILNHVNVLTDEAYINSDLVYM